MSGTRKEPGTAPSLGELSQLDLERRPPRGAAPPPSPPRRPRRSAWWLLLLLPPLLLRLKKRSKSQPFGALTETRNGRSSFGKAAFFFAFCTGGIDLRAHAV